VLEDEGGDATIERMALALRRPVDLGPEVDRSVMAAIRAAPLMVAGSVRMPRPRSRWSWLVRPRSVRFSVSPLGALAAAGVAIVAALVGLRRDTSVDQMAERRDVTGEFPAVAKSAPARDTVFVTRFILVAPGAKQVALVGDFNDWKRQQTMLKPVQNGNGMWSVDVQLPAGVYSYAFLVDGKEWKADPRAPRKLGDDFGQPTSVITVAREGMSS
jgi:hypothetical protein